MTKTFTKEELSKYDGQNGQPAYVAIEGVVYDVSGKEAWKGGRLTFIPYGKRQPTIFLVVVTPNLFGNGLDEL